MSEKITNPPRTVSYLAQQKGEGTEQGDEQHYLLALRLNPPPRTTAVIDYTCIDWKGIHQALSHALYVSDYELKMRIPDDVVDSDVINQRRKGAVDGPADCRDFAQVLTSVISDDKDLPETVIAIRDIWSFLHIHNNRRGGSSPAILPIIMTGAESQFVAFLEDTGQRLRIDFEKQLHTRNRKKKARLYSGTLPTNLKESLEIEFGCDLQKKCRFAPWAMLADTYEKPKRWSRRQWSKKKEGA